MMPEDGLGGKAAEREAGGILVSALASLGHGLRVMSGAPTLALGPDPSSHALSDTVV